MDIVIIFQKTIGCKHHGYLGKPTVVVSLLELTASSAIVLIRILTMQWVSNLIQKVPVYLYNTLANFPTVGTCCLTAQQCHTLWGSLQKLQPTVLIYMRQNKNLIQYDSVTSICSNIEILTLGSLVLTYLSTVPLGKGFLN